MTQSVRRLAALVASVSLSAAALTATSPASTAIAAAAPACGSASLAVTATYSQGGMGHSWMALLFRNVGRRSCSIYGYPGLDAVNRHGHVMAHATRTLGGYGGGGPLKLVTIAPGGFASASVDWMNFNPRTSGDCAWSNSIATTPANTSHTVRLPVSVSICDLQVHPTVAGTPGYPDYGPAQLEWIRGASATSADAGRNWMAARTDLKRAGSMYSSQVSTLTNLIALPDANQNAAQNRMWHADVNALNEFFVTPGLYN